MKITCTRKELIDHWRQRAARKIARSRGTKTARLELQLRMEAAAIEECIAEFEIWTEKRKPSRKEDSKS